MDLKSQTLEAFGTISAEPINDETGLAVVYGTAIDYNRVGYPSGSGGFPIAVAPSSAMERIQANINHPTRDVLGLAAHDHSRVLARTNNGTLAFEDTPTELKYSMTLDTSDPDALSAYRKIQNGMYSAASIGFRIMAYEEVDMVDNSPEAEANPDYDGEAVETILCTDIKIHEVSVLAHGAYSGATTMAARPETNQPEEVGTLADLLFNVVSKQGMKVRFTTDGSKHIWEFEPRATEAGSGGVADGSDEVVVPAAPEATEQVAEEEVQETAPMNVAELKAAMGRMGLSGY